jgi:hypothetical protein
VIINFYVKEICIPKWHRPYSGGSYLFPTPYSINSHNKIDLLIIDYFFTTSELDHETRLFFYKNAPQFNSEDLREVIKRNIREIVLQAVLKMDVEKFDSPISFKEIVDGANKYYDTFGNEDIYFIALIFFSIILQYREQYYAQHKKQKNITIDTYCDYGFRYNDWPENWEDFVIEKTRKCLPRILLRAPRVYIYRKYLPQDIVNLLDDFIQFSGLFREEDDTSYNNMLESDISDWRDRVDLNRNGNEVRRVKKNGDMVVELGEWEKMTKPIYKEKLDAQVEKLLKSKAFLKKLEDSTPKELREIAQQKAVNTLARQIMNKHSAPRDMEPEIRPSKAKGVAYKVTFFGHFVKNRLHFLSFESHAQYIHSLFYLTPEVEAQVEKLQKVNTTMDKSVAASLNDIFSKYDD